jgi:protein-S-isoprenylcysteine O-methyltransferase Ste14
VYDVSYTTEIYAMTYNAISAIDYTWEALGLVWLIGLLGKKPAVRTQPDSIRLFHMSLGLLGFCLLGGIGLRVGWLAIRFLPDVYGLQEVGLVLTIAGCLFATWARLTLGGNWSGRVSLMAGHELITNGPYKLARHPIYTGLLLALAGTALAIGEWRCVLGVAVILIAFLVKMSHEEMLLLQAFPDQYPEYRRRVKALIPGLL